MSAADNELASGTSGTVNWTLYEDGTLYFEPSDGESGTLAAYTSYSSVPWYSYRYYIKSIESEGTINAGTSLAYYFYQCYALKDLSDFSDEDTSASSSSSGASEDYFEWEDNIIVGLTDEGEQQTSLVIPARCEGFTEYAFAESAAETLVSVSFESDEKITSLSEAFEYLTALEEITLPASLTDLSGAEFIGCESLREIVIPAGVTVVGDYCFNGCESLSSVIFEGGTEKIGEYAFWRCDSLSEVVFCDSITTIGEHAFYECEGITSLTLPASLKTVGEYAFYGLGLEEIYVPEEMETESVDGTAFYQSDIVPVYVVEGSWIDENFDEVFYSDKNGVYEKNYI